MTELTAKQARFCEEYLIDLNATQAAIRAGYSQDTARNIASETLAKPYIQERVAELQAERSSRLQIDADWVLSQSVKLHQRCMNDIEVFRDRKGDPIVDEHGELQYVFNSTGAAKALELVGKHVSIKAFDTRVELVGKDGGPIEVAHTARDRIADRLARLAPVVPAVDDASKGD